MYLFVVGDGQVFLEVVVLTELSVAPIDGLTDALGLVLQLLKCIFEQLLSSKWTEE